MENNFYIKIGTVVSFYSNNKWRTGKIVGNNFAMCNLSDFCETPYYYIIELESDGLLNNDKTYAIAYDDKNLKVKK